MLNLKEIFVKKIMIYLCAVMLLSFGVPVQTYAAEDFEVTELTGIGTITAESLNVRSGPSKDYSAVGKAKKNETYTVTGQADTGWYRIDYKGSVGYVAGEYVTVVFEEGEASEGEEEPKVEEEGPGQGKPSLFELANHRMLITGSVVGVVILVILVCIGVTVKKMLAGDDDEDDEYDDEDDEYDEEDDEEYDEEAEEDEPYVEEELTGKRTMAARNVKKEPVHEKERRIVRGQAVHPKNSQAGPVPVKKKPPLQAGKTVPAERSSSYKPLIEPQYEQPDAEKQQEEDYRLFIDPRYFEDESPYVSEEPAAKREQTDEELAEAMRKLDELQKEIERIKEKKSTT